MHARHAFRGNQILLGDKRRHIYDSRFDDRTSKALTTLILQVVVSLEVKKNLKDPLMALSNHRIASFIRARLMEQNGTSSLLLLFWLAILVVPLPKLMYDQ
jgi:hypothetical protein